MNRLLLLVPLALSACSVSLYPVSEPPPTKVAAIDNTENSVEISRGVALAVECRDECDGACKSAELTASDPALLDVRKAYRLAGGGTSSSSHDPATFVVAGLAPGKATLRIKSECAEKEYAVTVSE